MKKTLSLLLCVLFAAALAVPALGDVIWEPGNSFYWNHNSDCTRVEADYEAQSDAEIRPDPQKKSTDGTVPAGEEVYIYYRWKDWGYVENQYGQGWVDLTRFRRLYNGADFAADHADEIVSRNGTVPRGTGDTIFLWTFPGSGVIAGSVDGDVFSWAEEDPGYYEVWTDENGHTWGHVSYYYGERGWVFLDDPDAADLPDGGTRYAEEEPGVSPDRSPGFRQSASLVLTLVVAVIAVTAVLLTVIVLKKRKETA